MVGAKRNLTIAIAKSVAIFVFSAFFVVPLWLVIMASVTDSVTFIQRGYSFWAGKFSVKAFSFVFKNSLVITGLMNSVIATVSVTVLSVVINTSAAYALQLQKTGYVGAVRQAKADRQLCKLHLSVR